eukprot:TRINITY_DN2360_c0_g1_i1.p2 TRINITY_DN2360_c0_g1~~TRINITY_DN2360_c0_g1_i1.p2  ORF type:complete len:102 (+),score=17.22 TRINITY_DN2360_c0_g1_i1:76-381(+)
MGEDMGVKKSGHWAKIRDMAQEIKEPFFTVMEVSSRLRDDPCLAQYAEMFEKHEIDGRALSKITRKKARELGIRKLAIGSRLVTWRTNLNINPRQHKKNIN